jgi:hypothetical protein
VNIEARLEEHQLAVFGIVLLCCLTPLFLSGFSSASRSSGIIFLSDHFIHGIAVTLEIFLAIGVSLRNASSRIAVSLALFLRFCE